MNIRNTIFFWITIAFSFQQIQSQENDSVMIKTDSLIVSLFTKEQTILRKGKFKQDSIKVKFIKYNDVLTTEHKFKKSGTDLQILYFYNEDNLIKIDVIEISKKFKRKKSVKKNTHFYIVSNRIFEENIGYTWTKPLIYMYSDLSSDDIDKKFYNENLTIDFIKSYAMLTLTKINNTR